ncbi:flagellar biosynthesis protein FlgL [Tumebacillus algifaecis]|uniref:Flagellar biosynthesis protein FlgL n=1 Tax=Tumebacillus algifaecis TaxID=1214604 RepID=A0A223CXV7_9BACL|nr:flagellar hook-associated protein FlgL [Tumebacillus algifaecis]ASS73933.1 flagellar biosynthesis protein FlgL [Tumebacillus algifaecis]
MRITGQMMTQKLIGNIQNNMTRMEKWQRDLATGKKIHSPSDDPVGTSYALRYRSELAQNDQFTKNVDSANSWVQYTDKMLDSATQVLQRARELAVAGANDTQDVSAKRAIADEIDQLYKQMVAIGNSQFNGAYVFNGMLTDQKPYEEANAELATPHAGVFRYEIGPGTMLDVNTLGRDAFGTSPSSDNAFQALKDLRDALINDSQPGVANGISQVNNRINEILEIRAGIGARMNRLDLAENRLTDIDLNLQTLQTKVEDTDMAETITKFKIAEDVYRASLNTGAHIIQPSLIDFLR